MSQVNIMRMPIGFATLLAALMVGNAAAQIVSPENETACKESGGVTVTVSDSSGALIANAFVLFRADRSGVPKAQTFVSELRTNSAGTATASVPCGYLDYFVAADGFAPHADKILIDKIASSVSVRLKIYPIVNE